MPDTFDFSEQIDGRLAQVKASALTGGVFETEKKLENYLYDTREDAKAASLELGLEGSTHQLVLEAPDGKKTASKFVPGLTQEDFLARLAEFSESKSMVSSYKMAIDFSSSLIEILNKEAISSSIHINLLKKIFRSGANTYFVGNKGVSRTQWALARVYSFLSTNKNKKETEWEGDVNIMSESQVEQDGEVDFFNFSINEESLIQAGNVLKDAKLDHIYFNSIHDIYMDDDGVDVSFLKNIL